MTGAARPPGRVEAVPRQAGRERADRRWPALVATSVLLHGAVLVGLCLSQMREAAPRPAEIPIELVQLPPPPKPRPPTMPAPKPPLKPPAKLASASQRPPKPPAPPKPPSKPATPPQRSVAERMQDLLGPMPGLAALALPGEAEAGEAVSYSRLVMSRIGKAKKQGRYRGVPGFATVAFTLGDGGEVTSLALKRPSGDPSLDTEAVALVKRAEPYPPPPPGGRRDYVVTLEFRALPP